MYLGRNCLWVPPMQENYLPVVADFSYRESTLYLISLKSLRSASSKPQLLILKVWTIGWRGLLLVSDAVLETALLALICAMIKAMRRTKFNFRFMVDFFLGPNEEVVKWTPRELFRVVKYDVIYEAYFVQIAAFGWKGFSQTNNNSRTLGLCITYTFLKFDLWLVVKPSQNIFELKSAIFFFVYFIIYLLFSGRLL